MNYVKEYSISRILINFFVLNLKKENSLYQIIEA